MKVQTGSEEAKAGGVERDRQNWNGARDGRDLARRVGKRDGRHCEPADRVWISAMPSIFQA